MSLTKEQQQDLAKLGRYFKQLEELAVENKIDLDVFLTEYKESGYSEYTTETIGLEEKAQKRKKVFEKSGTEKTVRQQSARTR